MANYADILVVVEGGENSGTILLASKFVEKNKVVIEKYSNYEISTNELIDGLKKWDD